MNEHADETRREIKQVFSRWDDTQKKTVYFQSESVNGRGHFES